MNLEQIFARLQRIDDVTWRIPPLGNMQTEGLVFASESLMHLLRRDESLLQVAHVATLPGIVGPSMAMPDIHWGYGFPIGGVAAFDASEGVVSPGGVGYDINCGVRIMSSRLPVEQVRRHLPELVAGLYHNIPSGVGSRRKDLKTTEKDERRVLERGAAWAVKAGFGLPEDLEAIEDGGAIPGADPDEISARALERGQAQLGTLGSGNHFIEIQVVDEVYDEAAAGAMGLEAGLVVVSVHTGSRGLGYQVCDDFLSVMKKASARYGIVLPDPQLCCAPVHSPEGRRYLAAMAAAANFAFANRQIIGHWVRETFLQVLRLPPSEIRLRLVYDVAHNIAKMERHRVGREERTLCVHRKGATRAFGPESPGLPERYLHLGQPVLVPGDMGRCSFVLLGTREAMETTFGSVCHGAGRLMSRHAAIKECRGRSIASELAREGIHVMAASRGTLAEEMPEAYKDVTEVVDTVVEAGLARRVCRLRPLGVVKG